MYGSESRVQRKVCRFAAQSKAAPLRRLAPARLGRPSRARCVATPPTEKHPARCLRHSRHREGSLRGSACGGSGLRPSFPPPASPAPLALPAATRMARNTWNTPHTARRSRPQYRGRPPRRADAPLRDVCAGACWHPREELRSAPPLRPGAAARQFRPSLCRCASQPLRGILPRFGGLRAPHPPRGPQAPFAGPPGHYQSVMEALPPNLRCSPAQASGWSLKGTPVARPSSVGRPARGPVGVSLTQKTGSARWARPRAARAFGRVKALTNNALRRVFPSKTSVLLPPKSVVKYGGKCFPRRQLNEVQTRFSYVHHRFQQGQF